MRESIISKKPIMGHMIMKFLKDRGNNELSEDKCEGFLELVYEQTDRYSGHYRHLLDEGWTSFLFSRVSINKQYKRASLRYDGWGSIGVYFAVEITRGILMASSTA